MDFNLSGNHELLRKEIVQLVDSASKEIETIPDATSLAERIWNTYARTGIQSLTLGSEYGGRELDPVGVAVALLAFARGCTDFNFATVAVHHFLSCVVPVWKFGSREQHRNILLPMAEGNLYAMQVTVRNSDLLTKDFVKLEMKNDEPYLSGKVMCSTGVQEPDLLIVIVDDSQRQAKRTAYLLDKSMFSADRDDNGVLLTFDSIKPSEKDMLGARGGGDVILAELDQWRHIYGSSVLIGTMQRLLEQILASASRYSRSGRLAGRPATSFQSAAHRLAEFKISVESAQLLLYRAAWQFGISGDAGSQGAVTSLYATDVLRKNALEMLRVQQEYRLPVERRVVETLQDVLSLSDPVGEVKLCHNAIASELGLARQ